VRNKKVSIALLGSPEIKIDDEPLAVRLAGKGLAMLAFLSAEPRPHSRDFLADLLWPECSKESARSNLRKTIFRLRQSLGEGQDALLVKADRLSVNHDIVELDLAIVTASHAIANNPANHHAADLASMEQAANLYRAPFLDDFCLNNTPAFEDWLCVKREYYHRQIMSLLACLSDGYREQGLLTQALHFTSKQLDLNPLDEAVHCKLMQLLAKSGQTSAALAQYDSCCRVLKKELGLAPDHTTTALFEKIQEDKKHQVKQLDAIACTTAAWECRQVTVLYCAFSLINTTEQIDLSEQWLAIQQRVKKTITHFCGHISQVHGRAILGYFGYPEAEENSARQAVRAALALHSLEDDTLNIHVGVHTGLIVTSAALPDVMGQTSMLAQQVQTMQHPVVISEATERLVSGYFQTVPLGASAIEGVTKPMSLFQVLGESGAQHRLEAATHLTPWVGREQELHVLLTLWQQVQSGSRHTVLIQGEAGIGKTRLIHTLKQSLNHTTYTLREMRCFPEFSQSPFYPLVVLIESLCQFHPNDPCDQRLEKLKAFLQSHYPQADANTLPLLAHMLALPCSNPLNIPAASEKEKLQAVLLDLLQMLAEKQAVMYIIEDLHWIDPSTSALIATFISEQARSGKVLMLLTARPEFDPPWHEQHETTINMGALADDAVATIIASRVANIPQESLRHIVARADGVPLFAEEMASMVERGQTNIPSSLRDLLTAKLDSVGDAKRTAQLAATIGREFNLDLLCEISPTPPMLNALLDAGLIAQHHEKDFFFKHALIQEAAYQSQTNADLRAAHKQIVTVLQNKPGDTVKHYPELLAQHLAAAGEAEASARYWLKAAQRSMCHANNEEAIKHVNCGFEQLALLAKDRASHRIEIQLHLVFGATLIATEGFGSVAAGEHYAQAFALSEQKDDKDGCYQALWGLWSTSSSRLNHAHSLELAEKLLHLAQQGDDVLSLQQAHYAIGNSLFWTGNPAQGRLHLEASIALYKPEHHQLMASQFGENICASSYSLLQLVLWLQGFPDQAMAACQQNIALAQGVGYPFNLGYTFASSSVLYRWLKGVEATENHSAACIDVATQAILPFWLCLGSASAGWIKAMQGDAAGALQIRQCLDAVSSVMSGAKLFFKAPLCEALLHLNQYDEALNALNEAIAIVKEKNDRFFESEFHRLKGECLLAMSPSNKEAAQQSINQALAISRRQQAKSLELRAAMSLAKHYHEREPLAQIYAWFSEGFDTPDLIEARSLLE
jgi:DNA-binding SARP family transcriptional activator